MPAYRLQKEALMDLPGTLRAWAVFFEHVQAMGGNVSSTTIDGKRLTGGRIEINVSVTLTPEQQAHLEVVPA